MNETLARAAIMTVIGQVVTDWTAYTLVVEPENRRVVDQATQVNPYLMVWIDFLSAQQADMADNPLVRYTGQIVIHVVAKCDSGTKPAAALRDFIRPYLSMQNLGTLHLDVAEIYRAKEIKGWEHFPLLVNFWYHETNT